MNLNLNYITQDEKVFNKKTIFYLYLEFSAVGIINFKSKP